LRKRALEHGEDEARPAEDDDRFLEDGLNLDRTLLANASIKRHDDTDVVPLGPERAGKGSANVAEAPGFCERSHLGRDEKNVHGARTLLQA
jgi:hypothetical protein